MNFLQADRACQDLESAKAYAQKMVLCVREDGMHILFSELIKATDNSSPGFRASAVMLIGTTALLHFQELNLTSLL